MPPAQFYGFRSEILASYLDRMCKQTESRPFFLEDKLWSLLYFFGWLFRSYLSDEKKERKKVGFQFVGWCMINIVSENYTQTCKVDGAMANPPLWQ